MNHELRDLREMLQSELIKVSQKGITVNNLEMIDKLSHSIKSIDTIMAMDEGGYSEARGRNRDSYGRYSRDGRMSYDGSYNNGTSYNNNGTSYRRRMSRNSYGYSRDGAKEDMVMQLQEMLDQTSDSKLRMAIQKALDTVEMD